MTCPHYCDIIVDITLQLQNSSGHPQILHVIPMIVHVNLVVVLTLFIVILLSHFNIYTDVWVILLPCHSSILTYMLYVIS